MEETTKSTRRWRTTAILMLGAVIGVTLVAQPAGAHFLPSIKHIWHHIKPRADARYVRTPSKYVVANGGGGAITGTFSARTILCPTAVYTPTSPQTAYINTTTGQVGGAGGSTFSTRAAFSSDGGLNYSDAKPQWAVGATAADGKYATNTNFGVINLIKGTHYRFALSGYIFAGSSAIDGDCKVVVEITPRKAGSGLLPRPVNLTHRRSVSRAN